MWRAPSSLTVADDRPTFTFSCRESPEFYGWIRKTYMYHQLGQAALLTLWGGFPFFVWVRISMHSLQTLLAVYSSRLCLGNNVHSEVNDGSFI